MISLKNKIALVIGIASDRSIATGIAKSLDKAGAKLILTYQNEKLLSRIEKIADNLSTKPTILPCDLSSDTEIAKLREDIQESYENIDIIIHSAAFAQRAELAGNYLENVTREGFKIAHDISSYSFSAIAKEFKDIINPEGSLLTLSYIGASRVVKNYNIMGVAKASLEANVKYMAASLGEQNLRVNAISAGPIKTLAASGISGFGEILKIVSERSPLRRNIDVDDVSNTALFLVSNMANGITGQTIYVDAGFNIMSV
tara:strand:+ start:476 stop:1249 length:774 start_codon:yes stop_codon:yes gene_type:complete